MKSINSNNKLENFLSSLKTRNKILHVEQASDKKDNKFIQFEFKVKYFLMFDKNGLLLINTHITEYTKLSTTVIEKLKIIVMKLFDLNIKNYETFYKHSKIFFVNDNFMYICITSSKINSCLIRLYLYFLNIVYLNLIGDNLKNSACLINISKIFEAYFVSALTTKFTKIMEFILSNKEKNSCKYLYKFKSLLIYYQKRNVSVPLFDYRKIVYRKELQYKYNIRKNEKLFNTINNLIVCPIYNNNYISRNEVYSHQIELYSTFPRWMIFGKFFKVYNGLNIIEIFTAKKLSKITNVYKEFEIKQLKNIKSYYKVVSRHSQKFIRLIELFTFNYLETLSNLVSKYNNPKNELLYFDLDLLVVTNDVISLKLTEEALINLIYKRLQLHIVDKMKYGEQTTSILLEEKNENSNSNSSNNNTKSNNNVSKDKNMNKNEDDDESEFSFSTISKSFLQIDISDIFEEIYQKRKSLQLSSFESNDQAFNTSEINETFQNISYIRNLNNNNNNYDQYSLLSYRLNDSKRLDYSGIDIFSVLDKQGAEGDEFSNLSKLPTEKQFNLFREKRSSVNRPSFNLIVNNSNKGSKNTGNNIINKNVTKRMSIRSLKGQKNNLLINKRKSLINNALLSKKNEKGRRSNSFTESGLFLKQFYSMMNNTKFLKNKHQILKEIQDKIALVKRNNSLKDLQAEIKLKNNLTFAKSNNLQNGKDKANKNNIERHSKGSVKNKSLKDEFENTINNKYNGGEIMHEYYQDNSTINFMQNKDDVFKKLNQKY